MSKLKCKILLVEDFAEEIERFERAIDDENQSSDSLLEFELVVATTTNQALNLLEEHNVDCAVVDLRIPASEDGESDSLQGNVFLRKSLGERAIPLIIHSGHTAEIADDLVQFNIKTIEKIGGEYPDIFAWFYGHTPLIRAMQSFRRSLMEGTALIFQKSILPHWKDTKKYEEGDDHLQKIIFRQIVAHLAEQLSLPHAGAPEHHLHEVYFRPPLREDRLHTGDIVRYNGTVHVIVTPQCNMVNDYPVHFLLAKCRTMEAELGGLADQWDGNRKERLKAKKKVVEMANQDVLISEHFLPPCGEEGPWIVEFKSVCSVPKDDKDQLLKSRIASITPQFIPNLVQRFAAYLGRHGQPNLNADELEEYFRK